MERKPNKEEWDEAERRVNTGTRPKVYGRHECPICGQTIREGAYSGRRGNLDKHLEAHERAGDRHIY